MAAIKGMINLFIPPFDLPPFASIHRFLCLKFGMSSSTAVAFSTRFDFLTALPNFLISLCNLFFSIHIFARPSKWLCENNFISFLEEIKECPVSLLERALSFKERSP
jgi:hypothetical protein